MQKYLAQCGVCSRREAERASVAGRVCVNGEQALHPGHPVDPLTDTVTFDGKEVRAAVTMTVLMHKPVGCLTSRTDPEKRPTIYGLLPSDLHHLRYVGRLDYNTSGVLLLTSEGDLNFRLTRPEFQIERIYEVKVRGMVSKGQLQQLCDGFMVDGEFLSAKSARVVRVLQSNSLLHMTLVEGKNREVRRLLAELNLQVVRLSRITMAGISVTGLEPGQWRELTGTELESLRNQCGLTPGGS
jgi:23S rRNA pseudouridine2605 synthase